MEFPLEEVKFGFSIAKSIVETINRLRNRLEDPEFSNNDESDENGDREDSIKRAILILSRETQAKKSAHVEKFVENTIENPECQLEDSTIFSFLKDIEQMTWRQLCLLEGFRRKNSNTIQINSYDSSGINGMSRGTEIKNLIDLNYLYSGNHSIRSYKPAINFDHIWISEMGQEISSLLDLKSVEIREIGKAFGKGRIQETVTY